ncbi:MAG: radical SAM protein [Gemmatimonadota bacterium]
MRPLPVRGRGASENPPNRFQPLLVERDGWTDPEDPLPRTRFLRDQSRSIISRNQSPDVGFEVSVNPYRGCENGCVYCLSGRTPVLMADGSTRPIGDLRVGDAIYGTTRDGRYRKFTKTHVLAHWSVRKPAYKVSLEDGTVLICGADHRFLTYRGWKFVTGTEQGADRRPHLTKNDRLLGLGSFSSAPLKDADYRRGYLCGIIRGDGHPGFYQHEREGRSNGDQHQFRLALADSEALDRTAFYLRGFGITTRSFTFSEGAGRRKRIRAIRTLARGNVEQIRRLVAWPSRAPASWRLGFLAGIFDAEGSYSHGVLRISSTDTTIIEEVTRSLRSLALPFRRECVSTGRLRPISVIRLRGGLHRHLEFLHATDPAIHRRRSIEGEALKSGANLRAAGIEPLGRSMRLFDITTGTGDFISDGVVSHNCYARPFHEHLGFSAGLDFETKILVKENAAELLRRALASPRWEPRTLALSGVTDPYQPAERRLGITRGCLEVLAEYRNPTTLITKSHLVTRDADLLAELARHRAASVTISVTTLDRELQRILEPRAPVPERRLAAIRKLREAGIPVGVFVAPVIPALTDHEVPRILEAAAAAGAGWASHTVLRLPHGVAGLFEVWLDQHFPARKDKVLNRLRAIHGGDLHGSGFGRRMRGTGSFARQISDLVALSRRRLGLGRRSPSLSGEAFRRPEAEVQGELF